MKETLKEENERLKEELTKYKLYYKSISRFAPGTRGICPKCGEYLLVVGYVCEGCGFDESDVD